MKLNKYIESYEKPQHYTLTLPDFCFVPVLGSGEVGIVHLGTKGYTPTGFKATEDEVKELNRLIGVTPEQADAMLNGSMFDWGSLMRGLRAEINRKQILSVWAHAKGAK